MTWGSDDWNGWIRGDGQAGPSAPDPLELLHEILLSVPGREVKTLAHVGKAGLPRLQFLSNHFERVVLIDEAVERVGPPWSMVDPTDDASSRLAPREPIQPSRHRFDILLAVDALARSSLGELDTVLGRVRECVVEGGLLLATFPAAPQDRVAREMRLRGFGGDHAGRHLHEVELQYRLRRAGFRGVRIRRIHDENDADPSSCESLLCMAVRRANN